jgi:hypothetical protein
MLRHTSLSVLAGAAALVLGGAITPASATLMLDLTQANIAGTGPFC